MMTVKALEDTTQLKAHDLFGCVLGHSAGEIPALAVAGCYTPSQGMEVAVCTSLILRCLLLTDKTWIGNESAPLW